MSTLPSSDAPPESTSSVNFTGGETSVHGDVIGGNKNIHGDEVHGDKYIIAQELAYDVRGCENPYLGLAAFTYAERAKYAGRKKLIAETVARITAPATPIPLLFVTGASGSGKSSFAQAGLLPALETFYDGFTVKRAVMRPAGDPFAALNDALWRQLQVKSFEPVFDDSVPRKVIPPKPEILHVLFVDMPPSQINLLVLDQFEEFFTQSPTNAREAFFKRLANLLPFAKTRTHIVATMRADYLPELLNHPALYNIAKRGVDLRAMNAQELAEAIQQPLRVSPYASTKRFEPSLVEKLAEDAAQDAAYLPLLQLTLQELWRKGSLKRDAYINLTDAIKQRADQVLNFQDYDSPNPQIERKQADQAALLSLMLDLVDVSLNDDARRDVRRQRTKADLTRGDANRERWVQELSDARLLSVQQEPKEANRTEVDLIHETLLTNWMRLQTAIAERREELKQRARFEQNLEEWLNAQRAEKYLLDGVRLEEARALEARKDVAFSKTTAIQFLDASIARVETAQKGALENEKAKTAAERRARLLFQGIVMGLVILLGVAAVIIFRPEYFRWEAKRTGVTRTLEGLNVSFEEYEVTNKRYALCVQSQRCPDPDRLHSTFYLTNTAELPITGIDVFAANTFCQWIGRRLPTNQEWELASTNLGETVWPWGKEDPDEEHATLQYENLTQLTKPKPVNAFPQSASHVRVFGLIGNVWEWTRTLYQNNTIGQDWDGIQLDDVTYVVIRGGSYKTTLTSLRNQKGLIPASMSDRREDMGFRCVE